MDAQRSEMSYLQEVSCLFLLNVFDQFSGFCEDWQKYLTKILRCFDYIRICNWHLLVRLIEVKMKACVSRKIMTERPPALRYGFPQWEKPF